MATDTTTFDEQVRAEREQANSNTLLLRLPAELRNRIYNEVLPRTSNWYWVLTILDLTRPEILSTSRQVRKEAASIFYSQRRFAIMSARFRRGRVWLEHLSDDALTLLRQLCLHSMVRYHSIGTRPGNTNTSSHDVMVHMERQADGFLCSINCDDDLNRVHPICPVVPMIRARASGVLDRIKTCNKSGFRRAELLELMDILEDAETSLRKALCHGVSPWPAIVNIEGEK